ncbi:MAG: hypothetical protein KatS3mg076_1852 [Candidatus Binatia bacterium]|nr:MAG: hypothetical protein KatS3mg076_1852 [Candidatus Binatia bacterium]
MKDLPVELPEGLEVVAVPEREDPRDVLVTREGFALRELPEGARVGTSSLRRMSLLWAERYDLHMVPVRGNVETRLGKLRARQLEALVLAAAGLRRLALRARAVPLDPRVFVPAPGQGALAVEGRRDGSAEFARCLDRPESRAAVEAERAFLATAGGSCRTPIAAYAEVEGEDLVLRALIASLDGARVVRGENRGHLRDARALGEALAERLLHAGGREILDEIERPGETEEEEDGEDTEARNTAQETERTEARRQEGKKRSETRERSKAARESEHGEGSVGGRRRQSRRIKGSARRSRQAGEAIAGGRRNRDG